MTSSQGQTLFLPSHFPYGRRIVAATAATAAATMAPPAAATGTTGTRWRGGGVLGSVRASLWAQIAAIGAACVVAAAVRGMEGRDLLDVVGWPDTNAAAAASVLLCCVPT